MNIDRLVRDLSGSSCFPRNLLARNIYRDLETYRWDSHGIMHVDRVGFEVIREGAKEQPRYHTALLYIEVVLDLVIAPVGQILCVVIDL
jgi:hypothetical protein